MKIGIIGGGQLAQMMILSAYKFGFEFCVLDPNPHACALPLANYKLIGKYDDPMLLRQLAKLSDVVTFDFENVPASALQQLSKLVRCCPNARALELAQDRLSEKQYFNDLGIATAAFAAIDAPEQLASVAKQFAHQAILKTRRLGYDGKGQYLINGAESLAALLPNLSFSAGQFIAEQLVEFEFEVSQVSVRDTAGNIKFYPLSRNTHAQGILRLSEAPYHNAKLQNQAQQIARQVLEDLDYCGVLAIEFFVHQGQLLVNEMAPRVHNSAHWTQDAPLCSQFENHMRAISELALGSTATSTACAMLNCIGEMASIETVLAIDPHAYYHNYHKSAAPMRKLGHINIYDNTAEQLQPRLAKLSQLLA